MAMYDYVVIGAGPAGAMFAYLASKHGYKVKVYDLAPRPALKACGWAVPRHIERTLRIPPEAVLNEIRGFRVYASGELVHESYGELWGYIVDKPTLIEYLLRGSDVEHKRPVKLTGRPRPRILDDNIAAARLSYVLAPGSAGLPQEERIYAVQQILKLNEPVDTDVVELYFEPMLIGYYWVFPRASRIVDVGVGGYEEPQKLLEMLKEFIPKRFQDAEPLGAPRGAWINVGGVEEGLVHAHPPVIGEAAGFVYPITGEGIRPSIVSAAALYAMLEGKKPPEEYSKTVRWIGIQRRLLDAVRKSSPETRIRIIRTLPLDVYTGIGLGELSSFQLLKVLARLPKGLASILRSALKK